MERLSQWLKRHFKIAAVIGAFLVGAVTLLSGLFGDNLIGRMMGPSSPQPTIQEPAAAPAEPATSDNAPVTLPVEGSDSSNALFAKLCKAGKLAVKFGARAGDADRFARRAGTTIITVPVCYSHDQTFKTGVPGESVFQGDGAVAGNRVEFTYQYSDNESPVTCRATAGGPEPLQGTIACEGYRNAMKLRPVSVEVGD